MSVVSCSGRETLTLKPWPPARASTKTASRTLTSATSTGTATVPSKADLTPAWHNTFLGKTRGYANSGKLFSCRSRSLSSRKFATLLKYAKKEVFRVFLLSSKCCKMFVEIPRARVISSSVTERIRIEFFSARRKSPRHRSSAGTWIPKSNVLNQIRRKSTISL